jgi:hypothetical protein
MSAVGRGLGELGLCAYIASSPGAFGVLWGVSPPNQRPHAPRAVGKLVVVPAGALPVPVSIRFYKCCDSRVRLAVVYILFARFSPAKAGFTAGQSSFTAVPGRQHNCLPFALLTRCSLWRRSRRCFVGYACNTTHRLMRTRRDATGQWATYPRTGCSLTRRMQYRYRF